MAAFSFLLWGVSLFLIFLCIYSTYVFWKRAKYFKKHKIPYLGAGLFRMFRMIRGSMDLLQMEQEIVAQAKMENASVAAVSDMFGGISIYITDPDLLKNVYIKSFPHFVNRRPMPSQPMNKYLSRLIFGLENEKWKGVRAKVSPSFSTSRIRKMHAIFTKSSANMVTYIKEQNCSKLDFSIFFSKYSMDVIASCAFGVDAKCWDVPSITDKSTFEQMACQFFQFRLSGTILLKFLLIFFLPRVAAFFGVEGMDTEPIDYFAGVIKQEMKMRRQSGQRKQDYLQMMMNAKDGVDDEDADGTEEISNVIKFDEDDVIANALQFLLAGFDPTQAVLLFAVYKLALEEKIQEKLYCSVKKEMDKDKGQLTYEGLNKLTYLDMVVNETLRIFPPTIRTERCCNKDFTVPGTDFVIKKGMIVSIPIYCIHHDENYFEIPDKFIPERFSPENRFSGHLSAAAFMPFGHGPRGCLGNRFALMNVKTALAHLIYFFHLELCPKTVAPVELESSGTTMKPKGGLWLKLTPR